MRSSVGRQINSADIGQISEVPDTAGTVLCGPTRHVHTMNVVSQCTNLTQMRSRFQSDCTIV